MGVLEDAIREHLDLKRKHGASDAELNQQETEALGATRRDVPESEVAEAASLEEPELEEAELPQAEPPEAALPPSGPEAPPAPADSDRDDDPDFGGTAPEQRPPPRDFDFD